MELKFKDGKPIWIYTKGEINLYYESLFEHYTMLTIAVLNMISCTKKRDRYNNYKEAINRIEQIRNIREMSEYETED